MTQQDSAGPIAHARVPSGEQSAVRNPQFAFLLPVLLTCLLPIPMARAEDDNGFTIWGNYRLNASSSLMITNGTVHISGAFDVAINDYNRFDLTRATLHFFGNAGAGPYNVEVLAQDAGCAVSSLPVRALFSIKKLQIGPTGISIRLVDNYDNGGGGGAEALYVETLAFEAGTTLDLAGRRLYYVTKTPANAGDPGSGITVMDSVGTGGLVSLSGSTPTDPTNVTALPDEICIGETPVSLSAAVGGGILVDWFLDGCSVTPVGTGNPLVVAPTVSPFTRYYALARDPSSGCTSPGCGSVDVTVHPKDCTLTAEGSMCVLTTAHVASVPDAGAGTSYAWTVTGGNLTAGQGTRHITYTAGTGSSLTIDVTVVDGFNCTCNNSKVVTVYPNPDCSITAESDVCEGTGGHTASVPVASPGPITYAWSLTGGTITGGRNSPSITYTAGASPTVTIDITVTDGHNCLCTGQHVATLHLNPICTISVPTNVCNSSPGNIASVPDAGPGATYDWTLTGGTITVGQNTRQITYTAGSGSSLSLDIVILDQYGCVCSGHADVTVNQPVCTITADSPVCKTSADNIVSVPDAGPGATYNWTVTGGSITAGAGTRQITYTAGTGDTLTIDVTVFDDINCTCSAQRTITVNPSCTITAETRVCHLTAGHTASVPVAINPSTYTWTITNGTITAGQGTPAITYTAGSSATLTLNVSVADGNGCVCTGVFVVTVNPPDCTITADAGVCNSTPGHTASVPDAGPGATYSWSINGGTITAGGGTRSITYTAGGGTSLTINVTVTDAFSCVCSGQQIVTVFASPPCSIAADNIICSNSTGHAASTPSAGAGATYVWSIINGTITAGQGTSTITYSAGSGGVTLSVTVTDSNGCISTCQRAVAMEEFQWIGASGGSFTVSGNWNPATVPGSGSPGGDAVLANTTAVDNRSILSEALAHSLCGLRISATGAGKQILQVNKDISLSTDTTTDIGLGGELDLRGGELAGGPLTNSGHSLVGYGRVLAAVTNNGLIDAIPGDSHILRFGGSSFLNQATALLRARPGSLVIIQSPVVGQSGEIEVRSISVVQFDQPLTNSSGGLIRLYGGALATNGLINDAGGSIYGTGSIESSALNNGNITAIADLLVVGNLDNEGTIIIQSGIFTVTGNLTGSGTLIGGFGGRDGGDSGLIIHGDFAPSVTKPASLNLTRATLQMAGDPANGVQRLEVLAKDVGARGITLPKETLYSINRLHVGPTTTTVRLTNTYQNTPGSQAETLYVGQLILDPGVTLDLAGLRLYYGSVTPADPLAADSGVRVIDSVGGGRLISLKRTSRRLGNALQPDIGKSR